MTESTSTPPDGPQEVRPPPGRIVGSFLRAGSIRAAIEALELPNPVVTLSAA